MDRGLKPELFGDLGAVYELPKFTPRKTHMDTPKKNIFEARGTFRNSHHLLVSMLKFSGVQTLGARFWVNSLWDELRN